MQTTQTYMYSLTDLKYIALAYNYFVFGTPQLVSASYILPRNINL